MFIVQFRVAEALHAAITWRATTSRTFVIAETGHNKGACMLVSLVNVVCMCQTACVPLKAIVTNDMLTGHVNVSSSFPFCMCEQGETQTPTIA